jgi:hypothetical protein
MHVHAQPHTYTRTRLRTRQYTLITLFFTVLYSQGLLARPSAEKECACLLMAPLPTTLSAALLNTARAATARAEDGQLIYGPIATLWDEYLQTDAVRKLPARLRNPLTALCTEISSIANKHFDAFIKGSHPPRVITQTTLLNPHTNPNPNPSSITYAQAAATAVPSRQSTTCKPPPVIRQTRPDTRLFVRIGQEHKARAAGGYAILCALKKELGEHAPLLKEVQAVRSGYALCTDSLADLSSLEIHSECIIQLIGNCKLERQPKWTTYRLDNIPRTVRIISGLVPVQENTLAESIIDITGQKPVQVVETAQSKENGLYNTSWFVSFNTESHIILPKTLRILGIVATATSIVYKPKTIQCQRCFQWHNTRCCTRAQRCRTCGSSNHTEGNHSTRCITAKPHTCPARCLHCGGPHPADDPNCHLRLTHKGPKTKSQREAILRTTKAARVRACAAAGCSKAQANPRDTQMADISTTPTRAGPESPDPSPTPTPTPSARFRAAGNRFTPLAVPFADRLRSAS